MRRSKKVKQPASGLDMGTIYSELHALCQREINAVVRCEVTQKQAYELLVPAETRAALKAAHPYLNYTSSSVSYFIGCGVTIAVQKDVIGAPLCETLGKNNSFSTSPAVLLEGSPYYGALVPLLNVRDHVLELHRKWQTVRHTIKWLHDNHSGKVIRWVLPAIKTLKGAQHVPDELDTNFDGPMGYGPMLPLIRETGVILSGAQFIPTVSGRQDPHAITMEVAETFNFTHAGVTVRADIAHYSV